METDDRRFGIVPVIPNDLNYDETLLSLNRKGAWTKIIRIVKGKIKDDLEKVARAADFR